MDLKKIALIGANGTLGPSVLHALTSAGTFSVTVLSRSSSKSKYKDSIHVVRISDDPSVEELTDVLKGQDAVVVTTGGSYSDLQICLADAAVKAGVKFFIPADFGSCDSSSERALELMPLYRAKQKVRQHLEQLATNNDFAWASLVCGHFFDYGLTTGLLSIDLNDSKARIFDGGEIKWSTTRLDTIATAVVRVLQRYKDVKNRMLYIQSFALTQNQFVQSLEQVTGRKFQVEHVNSSDFIKEMQQILNNDPDNHDALENLVTVVGIIETDWEAKANFVNAILGLKDEDVSEAIKLVVYK